MTDQRSTRPPFQAPSAKGLVLPVVKTAFFVWPVVIFIALQIAASIYRAYQGSIEGSMAVEQLKDESAGPALLVINSDIPGALNVIAWGVLILFVVLYLVRLTKSWYDWRQAGK